MTIKGIKLCAWFPQEATLCFAENFENPLDVDVVQNCQIYLLFTKTSIESLSPQNKSVYKIRFSVCVLKLFDTIKSSCVKARGTPPAA